MTIPSWFHGLNAILTSVGTVVAIGGTVAGVLIGTRIIGGSNGEDGPVSSVSVSPATSTLVEGATQELSATLTDGQGKVLSNREVVWESQNPSVAAVDGATRLVTAVSEGATIITATSESIDGTATITVSVPTQSVRFEYVKVTAYTGVYVCDVLVRTGDFNGKLQLGLKGQALSTVFTLNDTFSHLETLSIMKGKEFELREGDTVIAASADSFEFDNTLLESASDDLSEFHREFDYPVASETVILKNKQPGYPCQLDVELKITVQ